MSALVISAYAFAGTTDPNPISKSQVALYQVNNVMKLHFKADEKADLVIRIFDEKGDMLISTKMKNTDGFIQPFNFEELDYGLYTFEITDATGTLVETVNYQPIKKKTVKSSIVQMDNQNKVKLYVVLNNDNPAKVEIYDTKSNLLYKEKISESFSRTFDLSNVSGDVYFYISDKNGSQYHEINK